MRAALAPPPRAELDTLLATLRDYGQRALLRSAEIAAVHAALADGRAGDAVAHARAVLALAPCVDAWVDEPASGWLAAGEAFAAAGLADEAAAQFAAGAAWVEAGAAQWSDAEARAAWCERHPLHAALRRRARASG